jgi:tetratricopeptide (TPR) repeat protein
VGEDFKSRWSKLIRAGERAASQGDAAAAESKWLAALQEAQTSLPDGPEHGASLLKLGSLYMRQKRLAEAEPFLAKILAMAEAHLPADHIELATYLNHLALCLCYMGRLAEAESLAWRALSIHTRPGKLINPHMGQVLGTLGDIFDAQGRVGDAEDYYRRALLASQSAHGPDHLEVALAASRLGLFCHQHKKYADAAPLLAQALAILETRRGLDHPATTDTARHLGLVLIKLGRTDEAVELAARYRGIRTARN